MPVEIRELVIKGSVLGLNQVDKKFNNYNSPLLETAFVDRLKKDIIRECTDHVLQKLERKNLR